MDAARDEASPLHSYFEWNDGEAAERYRLLQAGNLVRKLKLHIVKNGEDGPRVVKVRAYSSLPDDRHAEGGYRATVTLLRDDTTRDAVFATALAEMEALQAKYAQLVEFEAIWRAMETVKKSKRSRVVAQAVAP